jgi:CheY-like chemotaxis protein
MRVLIVEENAAVAELYQSYLTDLGHDSFVAPTSEAALEALAREHPEAVMLDPALPGLNGFDFLRLPAVGGQALPVIAISSAASEEQARECFRLGALDYAPKPIAFSRLAELVGFLELHVLNKQLAKHVRSLDRRRASRVPAVFPVRIVGETGAEWVGLSVDLSPFGLRVRSQGRLKEGAQAKLSFTPPDGPPDLTLLSVLARTTDGDGDAFLFVNLAVAEFHRLSGVVRKLSEQPR